MHKEVKPGGEIIQRHARRGKTRRRNYTMPCRERLNQGEKLSNAMQGEVKPGGKIIQCHAGRG
jgi:hypothetical protein